MTTKIEWTHRPGTTGVTWNPVTGCTKISEGCKHCYAERMSKRLARRFGYPADDPFKVTLHPDRLKEPLRWRKPRTVFVCSMGDLFHQDVPFDWILRVWTTMFYALDHTYLILTKRPDRMHIFLTEWLPSAWHLAMLEPYAGPFPNVWLGTSIEKPEYGYRAEYLRRTPAALRFLSMEPLLASFGDSPGVIDEMDWIIVGGETGPGARVMDPDWARQVRDQCKAAGVPFFFKRMSAKVAIPDDLMIRQWPEVGQ